MGNIQSSVNQALVLGAAVKTASDMNQQKNLDIKYGVGGPVEQDLRQRIETTTGQTMTADELAQLREDTEHMRAYEATAQAQINQAKMFGIIPTKESNAKFNKYLEDRSTDIADITQKYTKGRDTKAADTDKAIDALMLNIMEHEERQAAIKQFTEEKTAPMLKQAKERLSSSRSSKNGNKFRSRSSYKKKPKKGDK